MTEFLSDNLQIYDRTIYLTHGDIVFKDSKIYCRINHTINHDDMHDSDFSINKNEITKIIIKTNPYIIKTIDGKYHVGKDSEIFVDSIDNNIYHITCTNLICKLNNYFHLLKKNNIYCEIGVKYGAGAAGVLQYSKDNNLNIELNLFEKDKYCCEFLRKRFIDEANVIEGNAAETLKYINKKFDFVFFDAHHHYKDDYPILQSLIPFLKESTVIIFDDYYYSKDVKQLVDEFCEKYNFKNVYTI